MNENKTNINWYPGHMAKTKREIKELLPIVDLVFELIDARIPYSSRIDDIDSIVSNKPRILIMTKKDLCDINETDKWIKKYEDEGNKVCLVNLNDSNDFKKILSKVKEIEDDINKKRESKGLKNKNLKALVIGIPNVGKSTFINRMAGKNVAKTGNLPGVTTNLTWLKTNYNILLLDTPGILWPRFEENEVALNLASTSAIKIEVVDEGEVAVHILKKLNDFYKDKLQDRYKIDSINEEDIVETYDLIGKRFGFLISGGEIDYDRVSMQIINDIKNESVKGITFDRYE